MIYKYKDVTPQIDDTCFLAPGSAVIGNVKIGKNSSVWYNTVIRGDMAPITIGENTNIQDNSVLHCMIDIELIVGNGVTVGHGAILHSCTIGDDSLIGMGSIILDGAKVGKNCVIAAGAVVTTGTTVPDGSVVMGSPGKVTRQIREKDITRIKAAAQGYIEIADAQKLHG